MSKSVYSIVLDDDVIKMIDMLSVQQGTSRSNMINRILARHINMPTAETIINDIYSSIDSILKNHSSLAVQAPMGGSLINMRSCLRYKYNPSVKYTVEIYEKGQYLGMLKVSMRTKNSRLIMALNEFFSLWRQLESRYCGVREDEYFCSNGRYSRYLRYDPDGTDIDYGSSIAGYIDLLDSCMKDYFSGYSPASMADIYNLESGYAARLTDSVSKI